LCVAGCASGLSQQECQLADWRTIGYEDGLRGLPQSRIGGHRKACAEHGVALDLDAYRGGWEQGVLSYCKPRNGYRLGRAGKQFNAICPVGLEEAFVDAYAQGRRIYVLESELRRLQRGLDSKRQRIAAIEVQLRDTGIELVTADITTAQRVVLLDELRKLEQERSATKAAIPALEAELQTRRQQLELVSAAAHY
jgi:hypothetical protein